VGVFTLAIGVSSFLWLVFAAAAYLLLDTFNCLVALAALTLFLSLFYGVNAQKRPNALEGAAAGQRGAAKADEDDEVKTLRRRVAELEQALDASAQSLAGAQRSLNKAREAVEEAQHAVVAAAELRKARRSPPPAPQNVPPAGASREYVLRCLP
jgi:septal ring factor EnvC (AmiA/AmiB activator)